jgi:hypothetical protein
MKKLNLLSKAEMKTVMGGNPPIGGEEGGRCNNDKYCVFEGYEGSYQAGGCSTMQTGQCRCVSYYGGVPSQSVPDSSCLN